MRLVTAQQMRDIDQTVITRFGVPGTILMERAGRGVGCFVAWLADIASNCPEILIFAGRGNNGGDAFAAAHCLYEKGFRPEVWLTARIAEVRGDASEHLHRMRTAGVVVRELPQSDDWEHAVKDRKIMGGIVVDGILGTGTAGPARGTAAAAIRALNVLGKQNFVVSIDIPSGLDADTGAGGDDTVRADLTLTMALPKRGLAQPCAIEYVGSVDVIDIGVPPEFQSASPDEDQLIAAADLRPLLPKRARSAHKGNFGHVLVIGGATGYAGAVGLAARAATRSGAGLVTALVPESIAPTVAVMVPECMVHPGAQTGLGTLSATALTGWRRNITDFDAILIGPGMTTADDTLQLLQQVLTRSRVPVVVDADALNVCRGRAELLQGTPCSLVITPHPGEMARLLGCSTTEVQADRLTAARKAAEFTGAVVVLKGAGTVVTERGRSLHVNMTGNPGLASGGTGDVLAGLITGFLAQGLSPFDAARLGVWVHGRAGDFAAWKASQAGVTAGDVIIEIPRVLRTLTGW